MPATSQQTKQTRADEKLTEADSSDLPPDQLGDTSTLADPGVVTSLVSERMIR